MTELEQALKLLWLLVDPRPCRFSRDSCNTHGWHGLTEGETCPVDEAQHMLSTYGVAPGTVEWPGLDGDST